MSQIYMIHSKMLYRVRWVTTGFRMSLEADLQAACTKYLHQLTCTQIICHMSS